MKLIGGPKGSGVYLIRFGGFFRYYGGTADLYRRALEHRGNLRRGSHRCPVMQRYWNEHGADSFTFEVVELIFPAKEAEGKHLLKNVGTPGCVNFHVNPRSPLGVKRSQETRQRMAIAASQRKHSDATKAKLSIIARLRPPHTAERRAAVSVRSSGENNANAKLTAADIVEIRKLYAGGWTQVQLAAKYKIAQTGISRIVRLESWRSAV